MGLPFEKDNSALLDSHEDRLQRLEEGTSEILANLATNTQKTEDLGDRMIDGFSSINQKIEACMMPLTLKLEQHLSEDSKVHVRVDALTADLVEIQSERKKHIERSNLIKKVLGAVGLAAIGAIAKTLFSLLFHS